MSARNARLLWRERQDVVRAEADDVGHPIAVHIGNLARIGVIAGPTCVRTEEWNFDGGWREMPASCGERDKDAVSAEADDVGHPIAVHIGKLARIGVIAGPTCVRTEEWNFDGGWREMPASCGERDKDAVSAEADDIGHPIAVHIAKLARIGVIAGPTRVRAEEWNFDGRALERCPGGQ